jgi:hypothetical protein
MKIWKLCLIISVLFLIFSSGCVKVDNSGSDEEKIEKKVYSIEYFPSEENPQIAVIVALEVIYYDAGDCWVHSGSHCFREAFKELSEKYEIGANITPIQVEGYDSSMTKELIVPISLLE